MTDPHRSRRGLSEGRRPYVVDAPKRATNVSINAELLRAARALKVNLSRTLEDALIEILRAERGREWLDDNREAIEAFNQRVSREGVFSDGQRRF